MLNKMEFWFFTPLKSLLSYFKDTCSGRKKSRNTCTTENNYVTPGPGTSTQNIIKLLTVSGAVTTASAIELPKLFFQDHLNQAYLLAFNESASSGQIDLTSLNKTIGIINDQVLSLCNVNASTQFELTPKIINAIACTMTEGQSRIITDVFNLISDKTIPPVLLDCVSKRIFSNLDWCGEDPRTLGLALGLAFGMLGLGGIGFLGYISYKQRDKILAKMSECYSKFRECIRPNVILLGDELNDSIINEFDEETALLHSPR